MQAGRAHTGRRLEDRPRAGARLAQDPGLAAQVFITQPPGHRERMPWCANHAHVVLAPDLALSRESLQGPSIRPRSASRCSRSAITSSEFRSRVWISTPWLLSVKRPTRYGTRGISMHALAERIRTSLH